MFIFVCNTPFMKQLLLTVAIIALSRIVSAQEVDFQNSVYFTRDVNDSLISTGSNLGQLNLSTADRATHPLFNDGIYIPHTDCFNNNIWIRIRHIAEDPNGTAVGINVPMSQSNPCQSAIMIGGWAGFLYEFELHADQSLTGSRVYKLGALYPTSITVASLETLSGTCGSSEWLSFKILDSNSTGWNLNSVNFTGVNPNSNPAFSDTLAIYTTGGCYPPDGFTYNFPTGADSISAINANQFGYSEFKMSAGNVSRFQYGYEYIGLGGGYQGMSMSFGSAPVLAAATQDASCNAADGFIYVSASGIAPFDFVWSNGATIDSLTGLDAGTYALTVTDQNGCVATLQENINGPANTDVTLVGNTYTASAAGATYQWINCNDNAIIPGATNQTYDATPVGSYAVIVTENGCTDTSECLMTSIQSIDQDAFSIFIDELNGFIKIQSNVSHTDYEASVYDMLGRKVVSERAISTNPFFIDTDFVGGIYCLAIKTNAGTVTHKFVIRK